MKEEIVYIDGREIKDLIKEKGFIYFNGYKYYLTPQDLEKLEDNKTYIMFQKYGMLFIKPLDGSKSVIVKRGEKVPKGKG